MPCEPHPPDLRFILPDDLVTRKLLVTSCAPSRARRDPARRFCSRSLTLPDSVTSPSFHLDGQLWRRRSMIERGADRRSPRGYVRRQRWHPSAPCRSASPRTAHIAAKSLCVQRHDGWEPPPYRRRNHRRATGRRGSNCDVPSPKLLLLRPRRSGPVVAAESTAGPPATALTVTVVSAAP